MTFSTAANAAVDDLRCFIASSRNVTSLRSMEFPITFSIFFDRPEHGSIETAASVCYFCTRDETVLISHVTFETSVFTGVPCRL